MNFAIRYTPTTGLVPGGGWASSTATPAAVGNSGAAGYAENAIACWDAVPYQMTAGTLGVGVVAFHVEGIARVDISIDGGPWVSCASMSYNGDAGVVEYWTAVHAGRHADGLHEMRAIAYPVSGVPRVHSGMYLSTNAGGTLPSAVRYVSPTGNNSNDGLTAAAPKLTIAAAALAIQSAQGTDCDGGTVYLLASDYLLANAGAAPVTVNRWLTLAPAPGVARSAVTITGTTTSGLNSKLVRLYNLTISGDVESGGPLIDSCWLDGCAVTGTGKASAAQGVVGSAWSHRYDTGSTWTNVAGGPQGYELVRGVTINGIGGDTFSNSPAVINCTVTDHDQQTAAGQHSDEWQWTSAADNVVFYGVSNTSGIGSLNSAGPTFESSGRDVAVVDCNLSSGGGLYAVYWTKPQRHVYVLRTTIAGNFFTDGSIAATNVVYEGCPNNPPATAGLTVR